MPLVLFQVQSTWTSAASEKQRRGRAGRCQPGVAFHLYSRQRSAALAPFQLPELQRTNLDELCLRVGSGQHTSSLQKFHKDVT